MYLNPQVQKETKGEKGKIKNSLVTMKMLMNQLIILKIG